VILAAIIALGASGLILMLLAIANPSIDNDASDSPATSDEHVRLRGITRTDDVTPAVRRYARPAMEVRTAVTREQQPPRRSATRKSWWRHRRDAIDHGYRRTRRRGILSSPDARFVAGTVACSLAVGLLIAHLST
jgi:hypothetical protein